jgi:transcriptional regulator with XRE-family HTH domain
MSHLLKLIAYPEQPPSRRMTIKGQLQSRPLSQANQEALLLLGNQTQNVSDPHGQCLRQARLKQGKSPAELATLACISLAQLYELESGKTTLFYTNDFALQAKRRVAKLLGEDWNSIASGPGCSEHATSNVRTFSPLAPVAVSPQPAIVSTSDDIEVPRLVSVSADCEVEPVKAQTAVVVTPAQTSTQEKAASRGQSSWWWVLVLAFIAGAGTQWPVLAQILTNV